MADGVTQARRDLTRARQQRYDAKRRAEKPWRALYKTERWKEIRRIVLKEQPICNICRKARADTVDHVERHFGDPVKFFRGPFQALCAHCHNSIKRSWEQGKKRTIGADGWPDQESARARSELFEPPDLLPSRPPLIIVAGPPAAGKTTYIQERAGPDDEIVDLDMEARRLGLDRWTKTETEWNTLLRARNDHLRRLSTSNAPRAWFCFMGAAAKTRAHFVRLLKPAQVVVLLTAAPVCRERIERSRPGAGPDMFAAIGRWHSSYSPRGGETVIITRPTA